MTYQALYRKYRSQRFDEMVGQEVVATTLKNAIVNGQISHAYLFSGPRGTGKTSAAKIFAKAINCQHPEHGEPDNSCEICQAITQGQLPDVIELDAASNNGVDEIREIRDKSTYAPALAAYKVYIIDEVHMLSTGAFNALLKTLEEPSPGVVFILATTELQKIPATILSRVQRFAFKAITTADIRRHLADVLAAEGVAYEPEALDVLAVAAEGGMRDALSLLDQALSFADGRLTADVARLVTGAIAHDALTAYVTAVAAGQTDSALAALATLYDEGKNMLRFTEELLAYFRDSLLDASSPLSHTQLYRWIDIALDTLRPLRETTQTRIAADVMTLRLIDERPTDTAPANTAQLQSELADLRRQLTRLSTQVNPVANATASNKPLSVQKSAASTTEIINPPTDQESVAHATAVDTPATAHTSVASATENDKPLTVQKSVATATATSEPLTAQNSIATATATSEPLTAQKSIATATETVSPATTQAPVANATADQAPATEIPILHRTPSQAAMKTQDAPQTGLNANSEPAPAITPERLVALLTHEARKELKQRIEAVWPDVIADVTSPREMALLKIAQIEAASEHELILSVEHDNLATIMRSNRALTNQVSNSLKMLTGLTLAVLTITQEAWKKAVASFMAQRQSEQAPTLPSQPDNPPLPEAPSEPAVIAQARALFGESVEVTDD